MTNDADIEKTVRLTASELARELGVSRQVIYDLKSAAKIRPGEDNRYDLDEVKEQIIVNVKRMDSTALENAISSLSDQDIKQNSLQSYRDVRIQRETYEAGLRKLKLESVAGNLVDRAGVELAQHTLFRMIRDTLVTTIPAKFSPELASITDPYSMELRLSEIIRETLTDITNSSIQEDEMTV